MWSIKRGFIDGNKCKAKGFTLAELLIALLILGVIATFTIPKVLQSQTNNQYKSAAKEVASMVSGSYQAYRQENTPTGSTDCQDMTPYMNYVSVKNSGNVDDVPGWGPYDCSSVFCLALHNGGVLVCDNGGSISFNNTAATNALFFPFDPDGEVSSVEAVNFFLYLGGRIVTEGTIEPNTCSSDTCRNPNPALDPPWFSWN